MKLTFRHFLWRIFGWPDLPPKDFIVRNKVNQYSGKEYQPRYDTMALLYLDGKSLLEIAEIYNVTQERVRQCLWKAYRKSND